MFSLDKLETYRLVEIAKLNIIDQDDKKRESIDYNPNKNLNILNSINEQVASDSVTEKRDDLNENDALLPK